MSFLYKFCSYFIGRGLPIVLKAELNFKLILFITIFCLSPGNCFNLWSVFKTHLKAHILLWSRFLGCHAMPHPKEAAARIGTTFLSWDKPITVIVPFSRTFLCQICPLIFALSLNPVIGDTTNEHVDFQPLFRNAEKYLRGLIELDWICSPWTWPSLVACMRWETKARNPSLSFT